MSYTSMSYASSSSAFADASSSSSTTTTVSSTSSHWWNQPAFSSDLSKPRASSPTFSSNISESEDGSTLPALSYTLKAPSSVSKALAETRLDLARLELSNRRLELELDEMRQQLCSVKKAICCGICGNVAKGTTVLACGHLYCASCIRRWFQASLGNHLQSLPPIRAVSVPTDQRGLLNLCRQFAKEGIEPKAVLSYTCFVCSSTINKAPFVNFELDKVIHDVGLSLPPIHQNTYIANRRYPRHAGNYFAGLFLDEEH